MSLDPTSLPYRRNVGIMVINRAGLVWVGRRVATQNSPAAAAGWWQMPQGGIDDWEEPAIAALRELEEETGMKSARIIRESATWHSYDLPTELLGRVLGGKYRGQTQKWFLVRFTGNDNEVNLLPDPIHAPEFDAWRWSPPADVLAHIVPFKREVYDKIVAEFMPFIQPE